MSQSVWLSFGCIPSSQVLHSVAPLTEETFPSSQGMQATPSGEYVPAAHSMQAVWFSLGAVPAAQGTHEV
jgi:hypothetical protein